MSEDGLTWQQLKDAWDKLCPPLYYATSEYLERGKLYRVPQTDNYPEYIACHPEDLETIKQRILGRRFIPLKDWKSVVPENPLRLHMRQK